MTYFCVTCGHLYCAACATLQHNGANHNITTLASAHEERRKVLVLLKINAEKAGQDWSEHQDQLSLSLSARRQSLETTEREIRAAFDHLRDLINKREINLLGAAREKVGDLDENQERHKGGEAVMKELSTQAQQTEEFSKRGKIDMVSAFDEVRGSSFLPSLLFDPKT